MKRRVQISAAMLVSLFVLIIECMIINLEVTASSIGVLKGITSGNNVKIYIRNASSTDGARLQIGRHIADELTAYPISFDSSNMRTIIMVDNSLSVPRSSRPIIKEAIKRIIDAHGEKEVFRLATFSETVVYLTEYSSDYTVLKNSVDAINHLDQETFLTDVLYDVINDLNNEGYPGYTRIIIFSDGVDNKPIGIKREELNEKLKETPYPIYTFGSKNGKNDSELGNMFELSRRTNCEYLVLEDANLSDLSVITRKDLEITVFEALVPEEERDGGKKNCKLTLSDGTELIFQIEAPFDPIIPDKSEQDGSLESDELPELTESEAEKNLGWIIYTGIATGCVILISGIVFLVITTKNKIKKTQLSDGNGLGFKSYCFSLTDVTDSKRLFRCEFTKEIKIGRLADNDIVISDDAMVNGHQAVITVSEGTFHYMDLKNVENHAYINEVKARAGIPQLITTNTRISIGSHAYVVSISEES